MKKILLLFIISFIFTNTVYASSIEDQLTELKNNINSLKTEVTNLNNQRLNKTYPIGSIYITTTYSTSTQVTNAIGGTWEVYGSGKTLVGVNTNDSNFNAVNKTGGSSYTTLSISNLPSHTHSIPSLSGSTNNAGVHNHNLSMWAFNDQGTTTSINRYGIGYKKTGTHAIKTTVDENAENTWGIYSAGAHTHTVTTKSSTTGSIGSGTSFTNLQPYITVYMYRRTA